MSSPKIIISLQTAIAGLIARISFITAEVSAVEAVIAPIQAEMLAAGARFDFAAAIDFKKKIGVERAKMNKLLGELAAKKEELAQKSADLAQAKIETIICQMREYGVSTAEIMKHPAFAGLRAEQSKAEERDPSIPRRGRPLGYKVPAKYRDAATGLTWGGVGRQPNWVTWYLARDGATLSELLIEKAEQA
jgi:DNA-binding protein H-NS